MNQAFLLVLTTLQSNVKYSPSFNLVLVFTNNFPYFLPTHKSTVFIWCTKNRWDFAELSVCSPIIHWYIFFLIRFYKQQLLHSIFCRVILFLKTYYTVSQKVQIHTIWCCFVTGKLNDLKKRCRWRVNEHSPAVNYSLLKQLLNSFFFIENAGELRFIVLRRRKLGKSPVTTHTTHPPYHGCP